MCSFVQIQRFSCWMTPPSTTTWCFHPVSLSTSLSPPALTIPNLRATLHLHLLQQPATAPQRWDRASNQVSISHIYIDTATLKWPLSFTDWQSVGLLLPHGLGLQTRLCGEVVCHRHRAQNQLQLRGNDLMSQYKLKVTFWSFLTCIDKKTRKF